MAKQSRKRRVSSSVDTSENTGPGVSVVSMKQGILDNLYHIQGRTPELATLNDWYMAVAYTVRDRLLDHFIHALKNLSRPDLKMASYLSAEFLMGPHLGNNLLNLGITDQMREAVEELGLDLEKVLAQEEEPGLGNGGLGRLAACYMDSLASLSVPAIGYGIRYEFGIFDQDIRDGWQVKKTDKWLRLGNPWEICRPEVSYCVNFGG
ncbi:MAG TPA: glycogen/starch/alpha-glucan phosphorylase, partial [Thermodesulfovibrionales bacterium]|nr:glycogen/starch/alpha-glucan phosphorylase [Thermodesulfovibrionales bacterium]